MDKSSTKTDDSTPSIGERGYFWPIVIYALVLTLGTLIHLVFLLLQYIDMHEELGVKTSTGAIVGGYACLTWLPLAVVCAVWLGWLMILICWNFEGCKTKKEDWILLLKITAAIFIVMIGVLYPVQVAIYLGKAVDMYLDNLPSITICCCGPLVSALLPNGPILMCHCRVPFHGEILPVYTNSTERLASNDSIGNTLKDIGVTYRGQVEVILLSTSEAMQEMADDKWSYASTMKMLTLLQLCLVLIFLRFPVWIVVQHHNIIEDTWKKTTNKVHAIGHSQNRASTSLEVPSTTNIDVIIAASRHLKKVSAHFAIEVCYFGFVEGADAFSLLEEVFTYGDYYAKNRCLSYAVVVFISLTLVVTTLANICSAAHEWSDAVTVGAKLMVVIVCNFPFFVIRMYIFVLYQRQSEIDTVFLLFSIKELVTLVLSGTEVAIGLYNAHIEAQANSDTPNPSRKASIMSNMSKISQDKSKPSTPQDKGNAQANCTTKVTNIASSSDRSDFYSVDRFPSSKCAAPVLKNKPYSKAK